jgi:hypothetical protein
MYMKNHYVMDYETLINCFVAVFSHYKTDEKKVFVIHRLRNDTTELIKFLNNNKLNKEWHISFNGLNFDSQITEYVLTNQEGLHDGDPQYIANEIYQFAQSVIERGNSGEFQLYSPRDLSIQQIDVFKLNHWDNPAKRSSLKWIEYSMDWYNIQEMPIHHSSFINTLEEIDEIVNYCINDVQATKQIMYLSKSQINLRKSLTEQYKIDLYSASEPRIAKELFLYFLSAKLNMKKYDIKNLRTRRENIIVKDIILPYVQFKSEEFKEIHEAFKELTIGSHNTKGGFKYSMLHKNVTTDFGLGGVHGVRNPGIYSESEDMIIMTSDVVSFYPNLAIRNQWSPAHLSKKEFCEQYEWFFNERKTIPKKDPRNYVYKIILNSTYGLSNDENSFLYDPEFTMRITINGQLSLMMLYEMISLEIPESVPLMQNTDGLETMIPTKYKDKYIEICKRWEKITNLELEHAQYSKLVLADVNNYIAVNTPVEVSKDKWLELKEQAPHYVYHNTLGKYYYQATKCKGRFEFTDLALHKNKSFLVIPKAIYYYFVHGVIPEMYLPTNRNIFDYCAGSKIKGDWRFELMCPTKHGVTSEVLQKTVRYYVTTQGGCKIVKVNNIDGRTMMLIASDNALQLYNIHKEKPFKDYHIDESYYLQQIYKEIRNITGRTYNTQLLMF